MTGDPAPKVFEDPALPHQMRVVSDRAQGLLAVFCNCMQDPDGRFIPLIEPAREWDPAEANAAYSKHLKEVSGP